MCALIKRDQVQCVRVDEATVINRYNFGTDVYDIVEMVVNGVRGAVKNRRSFKTYYITSGMGKFNINEQIYAVEPGDVISAERDNWLTIEGQNLKAMIIASPPFNAEDEEWKSVKLSDAE